MEMPSIQITIFFVILALIAGATYWQCRGKRSKDDASKDYFLAGGGLSWMFVAGSITLSDLSSQNLVGMNGGQMLLMAWWEISAVVGLIILCFGFLPVYYKYNCTTTTELLEKRFGQRNIRTVISLIFISGNVFVSLPITLYGGSLFMQSVFGSDFPIVYYATAFAIAGAGYSIFGGLRAVAVSDTFAGILLFSIALVVTFIALSAIDFDFTGVPAERLTMIGDSNSNLPWHTLLTGMIFIQMYYWSTNQTIAQRAMASPSIREAQKGVMAAAGIRLVIIPLIVVVPGIVAFKLYGNIGDLAYGRLAGDLLPSWLAGAFAAAMAAAVLSTFNSVLNSTATLYVCDIHQNLIKKDIQVGKLATIVSVMLVVVAIFMVPYYNNPEASLVHTVQKLLGLKSMPILSTFIVGLLFKNVDSRAMILGALFGLTLYGIFVFFWTPFGLHYIHQMFITLVSSVSIALLVNRIVFKQKEVWDAKTVFSRAPLQESA